MKFQLAFLVMTLLFSCESPSSKEGSIFSETGEKNGEYITRRDDGTIKTKVNYQNGKKHGTSFLFYADGKTVQLEIPYVVGAKHGVSRKYYKDGKLYAETDYNLDELHGFRKRYYRNGQLKAEIPYGYGFPAIGIKEYFKSGTLKEQTEITYSRRGNLLRLGTNVPCKDSPIFYLADLIEDKFFDESADKEIIPLIDGEAVINLDVYTPSYLEVRDVICVCKTSQGNKEVIAARIDL